MTKVEQKMDELGLEVGKLSVSLNKEVADFLTGVKELNELKESLESAEEDEREEIENDIQESEDALDAIDNDLVIKVIRFDANKAGYQEKLEKMRLGKEAKKAAKAQGGNQTPQPDPTPAPALDPIPVPTPPIDGGQPNPTPLPQPDPTPAPAPTPDPTPSPKEDSKEEKSDWAVWVIGGIVAAVTLGAVIINRRK